MKWAMLRGVLVCLVALSLCALSSAAAQSLAEPERSLHFLRIGTGPPEQTLYRYGSALTSALSAPSDAVCRKGFPCGAPGVLLVTQSRNGAFESIRDLANGALESALIPSAALRVAPQLLSVTTRDIMLLAPITSVQMHVVVRADSAVRRLGNLRNRLVVIGRSGSATSFLLRAVFARAGRDFDRIIPVTLRLKDALDALMQHRVDAVAVVGRAPIPRLQAFARRTPLRFLAAEDRRRRGMHGHFDALPALTYSGQRESLPVVAFDIWWVVARGISEDVVYEIARALWYNRKRKMLRLPRSGVEIPPVQREAFRDLVLPLHPGAARWYRERGFLEKPADLG